MSFMKFSLAGCCLLILAACQNLPSHSQQTLYGLTFEPWPWTPIQCFGCDWSDNNITLKDGVIRRVEARKSGELRIVAARGDRGGDIMKAFSISPQRQEPLFNLRFANSYRDAVVKITDKNGERRVLESGQFAPVYIDGELWTLYIVRATEWQDDLTPSKFLIDWVLLKE
ncbi:MAG TPA: hypothetical protein VLA24_12330 [Pseudomonadales bacterium]|nr:hypothetical protein [Pseudomonadales bacterium]